MDKYSQIIDDSLKTAVKFDKNMINNATNFYKTQEELLKKNKNKNESDSNTDNNESDSDLELGTNLQKST